MFRCLWLLLPAVGLYAADLGLTLTDQPATYWGGDSHAVEHNPLAYPILARHLVGWWSGGIAVAGVIGLLINSRSRSRETSDGASTSVDRHLTTSATNANIATKTPQCQPVGQLDLPFLVVQSV